MKNILLEVKKIIPEVFMVGGSVRDMILGKYDLTWVLNKAEELEKLVDFAYVKSDLQYTPNFEEINKLQMNVLEYFWRNQ